jgi:HK97 family phage prohead protease
MNKLFNLTSTFKSHEADDGSVMIRGMASTADFDRAGDSISAEAWQKGGLNNFEKNPIILFNHDYDKPIGRATGLKAGPDGLELECKISKAAPANVAQLVKDGVLGAFSVGFRVKDADYIQETDGLMIKDAELFEVSVVSVPCNQSATFSLAKSFDSTAEYEEFKKTFTNRVDLAGQSLAKDEVNTSSIASETPVSAEEKSADQEIKMDNQNIDLEAFAKQVAEDTAAKIAMKQAEQKAAEEAKAKAAQEAEEAKALEAESIKSVVDSGVQSGVEKLVADVEAKLSEKDANLQEVIGTFKTELEEKKAEIEAMRDSKRTFADRNGSGDMTKWGRDFLQAHILGKVTGKGFETDYAKSLMEKAGIAYASTAADIDQAVSTQIEKEVREELRAAALFREIAVNSHATVLPIQPDASTAVWQQGATAAGNLNSNSGGSADTGFTAQQVILKAYRLISQTHMDNNIDEEVLVSLLPMLTDSVARAHAKSVEDMVVNGVGTGADNTGPRGGNEQILGLADHGVETTGGVIDLGTIADGSKNAASLTAEHLVQARKKMGKYGLNPSDVAYVVGQNVYFDLLEDAGFQDLNEVGPMATKLTGQVGAVFGSPVIVTPNLTGGNGTVAAMAVNTNNFVIPRLRGVNVESDYSVVNQRQDIVATQSLGFQQLVDGYGDNQPCVKLTTVTTA